MTTKTQDPVKLIEEGCTDILYKAVQAHKRYDRYTKSKSTPLFDSILQKEITPIIVKCIGDILKGQVVIKRRAADNYNIGVFHTTLYMPVDIARVHLLASTDTRTIAPLINQIYEDHFTGLSNYLHIHALDIYISESRFIESMYADTKRINRIHRTDIGVYTCAFVFKFNYTENYNLSRNRILYPNG